MDVSVIVVVLALVALVSPVWLCFMPKADEENQLPSYDDRLEHITVLIMQEKDIDLLEELMIIAGARRLLLHDLLQGDKTRIVTGHG